VKGPAWTLICAVGMNIESAEIAGIIYRAGSRDGQRGRMFVESPADKRNTNPRRRRRWPLERAQYLLVAAELRDMAREFEEMARSETT